MGPTARSSWRLGKGQVVRDADGTPQVMLGIGMDITKRKQAEEEHRNSEVRYRQLAENIRGVFWMADREQTQMVYVSPAYEEVWGRSCESLYREPRSFLEGIHPDDRPHVMAALSAQRRDQRFSAEYRVVRPDGTVRWISDHGFPVRDAAGKVYRVAGIAVDITARKEAEEALRHAHEHLEQEVEKRTTELLQAETKYRSIFENATEGIFQTLPDGRYLTANPALARIDGYDSPEELIADVTDVGRQLYVDPVRRKEFIRLLEAYGVVRGFEAQIRRKDGRIIWVSENARAVRDAEGRLLHFEGTVQDITERKDLEEQLRQAQKMEAVGRLAAGIAHEFNNLLTGIIGYTDLVQVSLPPDSPMAEDLGQVRRAGERAAALTSQLLAFSRRQLLAPRLLDLNAVISDLWKMLRRGVGEDIDLVTRLGPNLGRVRADPGQVEQVLINLAVNARDAMPEGGTLTIETVNCTLDGSRLKPTGPGSRTPRPFDRPRYRLRDGRGRPYPISSSRSSRPRTWGKARVWGWPPSTASSSKAKATSRHSASRVAAQPFTFTFRGKVPNRNEETPLAA